LRVVSTRLMSCKPRRSFNNSAANHTPPHTATVTGAQIVAGNAVTLTFVGAATHNHTVTLSQADLLALKNKQVVNTTSTTDANHSHATTFRPV